MNKLRNLKKLFNWLKPSKKVIPVENDESKIPNRFLAEINGINHLHCAIKGRTILVIQNEAYDHLINALAEADQWTGFPYSEKVFENAKIIKN